MAEAASNGTGHSLETVPEQDSAAAPQLRRAEIAPVVFNDSFGPMGKDGQRASIAVSNYSGEPGRPADPLRRQSMIQFHTASAEDIIRKESVAAGKMPSMEARKMSVGERRVSEGGRRMSSPPPKR